MQDLIKKDGGWLLFPPIPFSDDTPNYDLNKPAPSPPSGVNWLGTDDQARDVLARVIFGARVSILFALMLTFVSALIGIAAGALQGYYGGWVDLLGQRLLEVWSGLPVLYLLIILSGFVEPNFWWLLGIMALFSWLALVDVVRAEFLRGRNLEYVKAARALGLTDRKVIVRHILPNAMNATLSYLPFILTGAISTLTALDFLGFGMPAGSASLGELIGQGKQNLQAPWLGLTAFFTLALILSLLVFIGEALRDAFDPRSVKRTVAMTDNLIEIRDLSVAFNGQTGGAQPVPGHPPRRMPGAGGRVGFGQVGDGSLDPAVAARMRHRDHRQHPLSRPGTGGRRCPQIARTAGQSHRDDLPGADDLPESAAHHREADRRNPAGAQGPGR